MTERPGLRAWSVRRVGVEAASELARLVAPALSEPWSLVGLRRLLRAPGGGGWLALDAAGRAQGALAAQQVLDELQVHLLAVTPAARRRGAARGLLRAALDDAWARGGRAALLELRASNRAASRLYETFGFRIVGRRPRYYTDGEDAVLLRLDRAPPGAGA